MGSPSHKSNLEATRRPTQSTPLPTPKPPCSGGHSSPMCTSSRTFLVGRNSRERDLFSCTGLSTAAGAAAAGAGCVAACRGRGGVGELSSRCLLLELADRLR